MSYTLHQAEDIEVSTVIWFASNSKIMEYSLPSSKRFLADPCVQAGPEIHFPREEFYSQAFDHIVSGPSLLLKKTSVIDNVKGWEQQLSTAVPHAPTSRLRSNSISSSQPTNRVVFVVEGNNGCISTDVDLRAVLRGLLMDSVDNPQRRPKAAPVTTPREPEIQDAVEPTPQALSTVEFAPIPTEYPSQACQTKEPIASKKGRTKRAAFLKNVKKVFSKCKESVVKLKKIDVDLSPLAWAWV